MKVHREFGVFFGDRVEAGRILANRLGAYRGKNVLVLGIPRGGVRCRSRSSPEVANAASQREEDERMLETRGTSEAFRVFLREAPLHAQAWTQATSKLDSACALDKKTESLAYLSVLAALGRTNGVPFHVAHAKSLGATRDEVVSAVLVGLPAAGHGVPAALPAAVEAFDHPMARELPAGAR